MRLVYKQRVDLYLGSALLVLLRLPVMLLGRVLRRDHSPDVRGRILVIKMQGGGSLVLAQPALLGLRRKYPNHGILLLTLPAVRPFALSLGVFDEIVLVSDRGVAALLFSSLRALWRCLHVDTVIDLEVYSRLTTVFSAITCARNRIGFFLESTYWRRGFHTHLVFFNRFSPAYHFYDDLVATAQAEPVTVADTGAELLERLPQLPEKPAQRTVAMGHACSEIGRERMLSPSQWTYVTKNLVDGDVVFWFLGSPADSASADAIITACREVLRHATYKNLCGELDLLDSLSHIAAADEFWGIDSGLLHFASMMGKRTISFWGPTDPNTRLRPRPEEEQIVYYTKVPCSPCIHVAESPPCEGRNICIDRLFDDSTPVALIKISSFQPKKPVP